MNDDKNWFDELNEDEIKKFFKNKKNIYKTPEYLDERIYEHINTIKNRNYQSGNSKNNKSKLFLKPMISFAVILLILIPGILLLSKIIFNSMYHDTYLVKNIKGKALIKTKVLKQKDKIKEKSTVKTLKDSKLTLTAGEFILIKLHENSTLNLQKISIKKNYEEYSVHVTRGNTYYRINDHEKKINITVESNLIEVKTLGTEFNFNVNSNNDSFIKVINGKLKVRVKPGIEKKLDKIKKLNLVLGNYFENIIFEEKYLPADSYISITKADFDKTEIMLNQILDNILNKYNKKKHKNISDIINDFEVETGKIKNLNSRLLIIHENKKNTQEETGASNNKYKNVNKTKNNDTKKTKVYNNQFTITKLKKSVNSTLPDLECFITADNNNLYITNNNNKLYCINSVDGSLKWEFTDKNLDGFNTPAYFYHNELVFCSQEDIYVLDTHGKIKISKKLPGRLYFNTFCCEIDDDFYIPVTKTIYKFNNTIFSQITALPDSSGQIFAASFKNLLYCTYSNEKEIKIYDLISNKIIWNSKKLRSRSFKPVVISEKYFFAFDENNNIYKFKNNLNRTGYDILRVDTGITGNAVNYKNLLFFNGTNGYLYKINIDNFIKAVAITKLDDSPYKVNCKSLLIDGDSIYYCMDNGKLFYYNITKQVYRHLNIQRQNSFISLAGSPVKIDKNIYLADSIFNIYKVRKNY